jgi:hypothetical protein
MRTLLVVAAASLLLGCQGKRQVTPSPIPPGYRPTPVSLGSDRTSDDDVPAGEELDEKLAVVAGEVITRRRLAREMRGLGPGEEEAAFERRLHEKLLERARLLLFVREAQRAGITIQDDRLDEVVEESLERSAKEASETIGETVTVEDWLREQNLTHGEFRERTREQLYYQAYLIRLLQGIGGPTRPVVDMVVTPAEVRRVYWSHPGAFDEKAGIRFAAFQLSLRRHLDQDLTFAEAEQRAEADARSIVEAYGRGEATAAIVRRFELEEGEWRVSKTDEFVTDDSPILALLGDGAPEWLFAPERKHGDANVFPDPQGFFVLGIEEIRPARRIEWHEAYDRIVTLHQLARQHRLERLRLIEILSTRNEVQPPALADELLARTREELEELSRDPVLGAARFR